MGNDDYSPLILCEYPKNYGLVQGGEWVMFWGAIVSVVCYIILFSFIYGFKLSVHPIIIAKQKFVLEFLFVSQFLWLPFVKDPFLFWVGEQLLSQKDQSCSGRAQVSMWPLAFLTQFSMLGSELWFFILSFDVRLNLTNPFVSSDSMLPKYMFIVYFISILSAVILVALGPDRFGLSSDPMLWIQDEQKFSGSIKRSSIPYNNDKIFCFYMWMIFIYGYAVIVAGFSSWRLLQVSSLSNSMKARASGAKRGRGWSRLNVEGRQTHMALCRYINKKELMLLTTFLLFKKIHTN